MLRFSHPFHLVLGFLLWSLWFVVAYSGLSVACAVAPPAAELGAKTWINFALLLFTGLTALVLLYLARRCWRTGAVPGQQQRQPQRHQRFVLQVAAALYLAAAMATLAVGLPTLVLPPCV